MARTTDQQPVDGDESKGHGSTDTNKLYLALKSAFTFDKSSIQSIEDEFQHKH